MALIENVSLPNEQVIRSRLDMLPIIARASLSDGPAIILIGEAVAVGHDQELSHQAAAAYTA